MKSKIHKLQNNYKNKVSKKVFFVLLFPTLIFSQQNYQQHVNPFIGTGGHGHTFPGATVPYGMVQLSPDTRIDGSWDGCGGYHYDDSSIYGFSHTHLNGTGCTNTPCDDLVHFRVHIDQLIL